MKLRVDRIYTCGSYTIGHLYVNGIYVCDTIEDADRRLTDLMLESEVRSKKVYGKTAIPSGTYNVTMDIKSPKYSSRAYYRNLCDGYLPRLLNVKGFQGILIHVGNTADDSLGCILVGYNTVKGKVLRSKEAFEKLMKGYLLPAKKRNENITIEIGRKY